MSGTYDQDPANLSALMEHSARQLDGMMVEPVPNRPQEELYGLQTQAEHLGALTIRLLQVTWQAHGELPRHMYELDAKLLGGRIIPVRMHAPISPHYLPRSLSIVGHREIAGPKGRFAFAETDFGEQELLFFNSALAYRNELPAMRNLKLYFGWNPSPAAESTVYNCNRLMGDESFKLRTKGQHGRLLWMYPGLHIEDQREQAQA